MSSSLHNANSGQLLTMAVAFSAALAQDQSSAALARLGAFFTIVGDTLTLYSLEPGQSNTSASQAGAAASAISLGENL